jgi:hypothetical protein
MTGPKDMTNTRTWNKLKTTTTHPYTEWYFEVFTSPNLKKRIEVYSGTLATQWESPRGTCTPLGEKMAGGEYRAEKWSAGPVSFPAGGHPLGKFLATLLLQLFNRFWIRTLCIR